MTEQKIESMNARKQALISHPEKSSDKGLPISWAGKVFQNRDTSVSQSVSSFYVLADCKTGKSQSTFG